MARFVAGLPEHGATPDDYEAVLSPLYPWLHALTESAIDAPIPIVLGGHNLVGPGVRLVLGEGRSWT